MFLHAASLGFQLTLLDIGGGYPGSRGSREVFQRVASAVRASLEELFSRYPHLTVIAEPGTGLGGLRQHWGCESKLLMS